MEESLLAALLDERGLDAHVDLGQQAQHGAHVLLFGAQVLHPRGVVDLQRRGAVRAAHLREKRRGGEVTEGCQTKREDG